MATLPSKILNVLQLNQDQLLSISEIGKAIYGDLYKGRMRSDIDKKIKQSVFSTIELGHENNMLVHVPHGYELRIGRSVKKYKNRIAGLVLLNPESELAKQLAADGEEKYNLQVKSRLRTRNKFVNASVEKGLLNSQQLLLVSEAN